MDIRPYTVTDKSQCLAVFDSNCPQFFDPAERAMFANWLDHVGEGKGDRRPAFVDSTHETYFVMDQPGHGIIACGGFYLVKSAPEARLAWGMVDARLHGKSHGSALYLYRREAIRSQWPQHQITLGTSQHTRGFYEKMGMRVTNFVERGYGDALDRYDMTG